MNTCLKCKKLTTNPKFCSRSCSASYNDKLKPKRQKLGRCFICNVVITTNNKYCLYHRPHKYTEEGLTIEQIKLKYKNHYSAPIRDKARRAYKETQLPKFCIVCGYSKFYELCHLKAINTFSDDTPISVVNDFDNLVPLCPTHHWEYDHHLLDPDEVDEAIKRHDENGSQHALTALYNMAIHYKT